MLDTMRVSEIPIRFSVLSPMRPPKAIVPGNGFGIVCEQVTTGE